MFKKNLLSLSVKSAFALTLASAVSISAANAQQVTTDAAAKDDSVERVQVTGSRIKRIAEVAPTPVTVITGAEMVNQGITNVADLLQKLPGSATGSAPTTTASTIFGAGINTTDLRELGSERTLVLVNGRRFISASVTNPSVNLNNIPTSMIERIEVVHGGASAVYGSDAVAGVVNIITKKSYDGVSFDYLTSRPQQSGGENDYYSFTFGDTSGKTEYAVNVSYSELGQLKQLDRDFIRNPATSMLNPLNKTSSDGIPSRVRFDQNTTLAAYDKRGDARIPGLDGKVSQVVFGADGKPQPFNFGTGKLPNPNGAYYTGDADGYDFLENGYIATPLDRLNMFATVNREINDDHKLTAEMVYAKDTSYAESSPVFLSNAIRVDNAFWHPDAQAGFKAAGWAPDRIVYVNKLAADFGNRKYSDDRVAANFTLGLEGVVFEDYDYNLYAQQGINTTNTRWFGEVLTQNLEYALDAVKIDGVIACAQRDSNGVVIGARFGCEPLNTFGSGAASKAALDYLTTVGTLYMKKSQQVFGGNVGGTLFELPAGFVSFAVSAEHRREHAESSPDTGMSKGLIFGNIVRPWEGSMDVSEVGVETSVPLLSDMTLVQELTLDLAARYMDYSSVGENVAWKAGFSWQPIDEVRVRATRSKSVRAPDLDTLYSQGVQSFGSYGDPCDAVALTSTVERVKADVVKNCIAAGIPVNLSLPLDQQWRPSEAWRQVTPPSMNGGNPSLQEETSSDTLIGFIYTPTDDITLIVDWWNFKVNDAINALGPQTVVNNCYEASSLANPSCKLVTRATNLDISNVINAPYNVATYELKGVDAELGYSLETEFGNFSTRLLTTYLQHREFVENSFASPYVFVPTVGEQRYPRWKARLTVNWSYEDASVSLTSDYRHATVGDREWTIEQNDYNNIPSYTKWNLSGSYDVTENLIVRAGVRNLFDITPPRNPFSYSNGEFYDAYGRTFELGFNVNF